MKTRKVTVTAVITLLMVTRAFAPTNVSIGNGFQQSNGTYLNAQKIAGNLAITSITIQASGQITIVTPSDLSTSSSGTPHFDLWLVTPTLNVDYNLNMAATGTLYLTTSTINLDAPITSGGTLINPSRIIGAATVVNVLSNAASVQQAIDIAAPATPVTVQISPGQYPGDLTINNEQVTLLLLLARTNRVPVIINATNLIIGLDSSAATNDLTINGGVLYVTNALATGALDVRNGTLTISNVTATVDNLLLTNGTLSTMIFSKGTFQVGSTTVTNGQQFVIGDGADIANYVMQGETHSFNNGLVITNNSILSGCGTVNGAVTNYGTIYLNHGCDMYFNGQVVNYGKIISAANATPHFTGGLVDYTTPRSFPVLTSDGGIEVVGGQFTFTVAWNTNQVVVVETSTDLQNWTPVQTNTMITPYFQVAIPAPTVPGGAYFRVRLSP
jgi:hypothetical protein